MSSTSDETPEADIRDLLVEAFFTGNVDRVRDLGQAIVERSLEPGADIMPFGDEVASGTLLTPDSYRTSSRNSGYWTDTFRRNASRRWRTVPT